MFYIHGGSYSFGGMCDPLYDFERLARDNPDVVFVSCDYRVNAFGYLDLTGLPGYDPEKHKDYDQSVNLGVLDLQEGLRWVKENIANFGGNTNNVTTFGESAGGGSVSCLLQAKGSEGLFNRAIVMSGALDLTDSPENYKAGNQAYLLMKAAGKSSIDELLECSTDELLAALDRPLNDPAIATIRHRTPREGVPLKDVDRRFGRISGTLALVYIAVFAKFGLWQALTERCCGMLATLVLALPLTFLRDGKVVASLQSGDRREYGIIRE